MPPIPLRLRATSWRPALRTGLRTALPAVLAGALLLACSAPAALPPLAGDALGLGPGLDGTPLLDPEEGNCAADALDLREQGFRLQGSVGGIALASSVAPVATAQATAAGIAALAPAEEAGSDVGLLVVDDFGEAPLALAAELVDLVEPKALERLVDDLVASARLSHGQLVLHHQLALLAALPGVVYDANASAPAGGRFVFLTPGGSRVVVRTVDARDYRSDRILDRMGDALDDLQLEGINRAATNMSFALVPCSVLDDYRGSGAPSLEAYVQMLIDSGHGGTNDPDDLLAALLQAVDGDPLETYLATLPVGMEALVHVASAGNYGLDYPLAPAVWTSVVAASAAPAGTAERAGFSNAGQVLVDGAWFRVTDAVGVGGPPTVAAQTVVAGTSFAAPGLTLLSALDLAREPACYDQNAARSRFAELKAADAPLADAVAAACEF